MNLKNLRNHIRKVRQYYGVCNYCLPLTFKSRKLSISRKRKRDGKIDYRLVGFSSHRKNDNNCKCIYKKDLQTEN